MLTYLNLTPGNVAFIPLELIKVKKMGKSLFTILFIINTGTIILTTSIKLNNKDFKKLKLIIFLRVLRYTSVQLIERMLIVATVTYCVANY